MMPNIVRIRLLFLFAFIMTLFSSAAVYAGIYQWKDDNGKVHFSDNAPKNHSSNNIEDKISSRINSFSDSVNTQQKKVKDEFFKLLRPVDPVKPELFLVTFAGDAKQKVFMREVLYIQELFKNRYGVDGHSVALINHSTATSKYLVASDVNLAFVLEEYGKIMKDEDILYLYLTSHGSRKHKLSVDFPPYAVKDFGPEEIRQMLDDAGIKWRIIVVSACYSGGFIEKLRSPDTLIATASDAVNTSFGCADDRDFTYYGEAIFKNLMSSGIGMVPALDGARAEIYRMETEKNTDHHSNPQFWEGDEIHKKLSALSL
jgi:hypothetical protein